MASWSHEKRARFVLFFGIGFLALLTIDPYEYFSRIDYQDSGWLYSDGWMHIFSCGLILIASWKWIDARSDRNSDSSE